MHGSRFDLAQGHEIAHNHESRNMVRPAGLLSFLNGHIQRLDTGVAGVPSVG